MSHENKSQLKLLIFYEFQLKLIENLKLSHVQIDKSCNVTCFQRDFTFAGFVEIKIIIHEWKILSRGIILYF